MVNKMVSAKKQASSNVRKSETQKSSKQRQPTVCRFTASVDEDTFERVKYWAAAKNLTINELLRDAIALYIAYQNNDYALPALEIQRLNQLVDAITTLSSNVGSLEKVVISGFDSLISLTRGDNYLLDDDDGELSDDD